MNKLIGLFLVLTLSGSAFAQSKQMPEAYVLYFKTWNFIKYYHPDLASGKVDADSLFFKHLSEIDRVTGEKSFNQSIKNLLASLSIAVGAADSAKEGKDVIEQNLNFDWYKKGTFFNKKNRKNLDFIFKNRYVGNDHYFIPERNYNALLPHEKEYDFPDNKPVSLQYRMLALAKIQGVVDYLYPHKYLMEQNFDRLLESSIFPTLEEEGREEYEQNLLELAASLQDSHTFGFYKQMKAKRAIFKNSVYPPFNYQVFDDGILVTELIIPESGESHDVRVGDYIVAINGKPVQTRIKELALLLSTSNRQTLVYHLSDYVENLVWGTDSKQVNLEILRNGEKQSRTIPFTGGGDPNLQKINAYLGSINPEQNGSDSLVVLKEEIAYFNIHETFRFIQNIDDSMIDKQMDSILNMARSKKGIIFDMRGYPDWGGFVYTYLLKSFASELSPFAKYYEINKQKIGTYVYKGTTETYYNTSLKVENTAYKGKVVIIVNPATQSMSEWHTMCIQQLFPNSITIGEQSAGADGDLKTLNLPGAYQLDFTGNAIFYKDGTEAQKKGVKIDIPIKLTKENFSKDKDYMLEKAVELILN